MAQRSKRKFDYFQQDTSTSPGAMSQANISGPTRNPIYYNDHYEPIPPTPELQELYNTWRQLEEQEELRNHLQEQAKTLASGSSDGGQHNAFLRPPSPSATSMSRSPSCASTSNSVTGGINNMALGDDKPTRRKQGRQGPLGATRKARTALLRKLHACDSCHRRKVACLHHNFGNLEDAFQRSKQGVPPRPQRLRQNNPENTRAQLQDLFGVGERPNLNIFPPNQDHFFGPVYGQEDPNVDFNDLLSQAPSMSPNATAPLYRLSDPLQWQNIAFPTVGNTSNIEAALSVSASYPYPTSFSPLVPPSSAPPMAPRTAATDPTPDRHLPIGRRIAPDHGQDQGYLGGQYAGFYQTRGAGERGWEWECRFGDDGTLSSCSLSDSNEAPKICKQRYPSLDNLKVHFQKDHLPFENGKIYPFCKPCSQHYDYDLFPSGCPTCGEGGGSGLEMAGLASPFSAPFLAGNHNAIEQSQEQWFWGDLLPAPDHGTGQRRTGRVLSEDGGLAGGGNIAPLARSGTITQLDVWNQTFYGGNGYGGGGGGGGGGAAAQGATGRGNLSCSMSRAPDFSGSPSSTGDVDKHGNSGNSYRDPFVNLFLSPSHPPPSLLLKPPTSKMLPPFVTPLSAQLPSTITRHDRSSLSCQNSSNPNAPKRTPTTRGRARSCPYYACSKELFSSRGSRSPKKDSTTNAHSALSISLSSGLPWPTTTSAIDCNNMLAVDSSTARNLASCLVKLLLLVLTMLALTHGLSFSSTRGAASAASWHNNNNMLLLLPTLNDSHARDTATTNHHHLILERSVVCLLLGLVGTWLVRRNLLFRRVLLAAGKDELRSRRQMYQREQDISGLGYHVHPRRQSWEDNLRTRFHGGHDGDGHELEHEHAHEHAFRGYHVQATAAAAG